MIVGGWWTAISRFQFHEIRERCVEFFGVVHYSAFILAGILLNLTPGNDTMYILGRSIAYGERAGIVSALGISSGSLLHSLAAATGLSVVLMQSATAFNVLKFCGAAYLVYTGTRMFFFVEKQDRLLPEKNAGKIHFGRLYAAGVLTNVLNPKVALFFSCLSPPVYRSCLFKSHIRIYVVGYYLYQYRNPLVSPACSVCC